MVRNQKKAGVVISYVGQIVHILTALIYTPIMLRLLGQSEYGLYQLVYSVVSYLSLLSLGFGSSYMRFYAREKADSNEVGVAKLNGMFMLIFSVISIVCVLCGLVMIINIHDIFGTGLSETEYAKAKVLMALMILNMALTFPNSVFNCIIISQERFLFQKTLLLIQYIANPFITLPLLILGYGSIGMVTVTTLLTVGVLLTNVYYCIKELNVKFEFRGLQFYLLKEMAFFTFFIFLNQIIDQINWNVDKYLLGRISGTIAVAIYSVGGQINSLYLQLSTSVSNVFVPQVNRVVAETNDNVELSRIFTKVGRVQFMIMMLIVTGFLFFGKPFIRLWAGAGYEESYYVTLILIIPVTVPLIQNIGIEIQRAKNKHKTRSVVYLCIAIANIFLSITLIKMMGPTGAAIGTAISLIAGNIIFMNWYYYKKLGIDIPMFWKSIAEFIPGILLAAVFGIVIMLIISYKSGRFFVIGAVVYTTIYCIGIYYMGMNPDEKGWVMKPIYRIKSILSKGSITR